MRKPHRSSTVLPVCTDHSYLTGRLQRRVWGEIRQAGDTDRALSQLCQWFAALFPTGRTTAPLETAQDRKSDGKKLLPDSQQAATSAPVLEQQEEHKFHTNLFQTHRPIRRPFLKSGANLQHQPVPSILCPALSDPTVPYLRAHRVCTGSSTIHTCHLCHLKGTAEATCKHGSSSGGQVSASSVCIHGEPPASHPRVWAAQRPSLKQPLLGDRAG